MRNQTLQCFPCDSNSSCCLYGASLTITESEAIRSAHGESHLVFVDGEFRTAVTDSGCVFLGDNCCRIHGQEYYPEICRRFPYTTYNDEPYSGALSICPNLVTANLQLKLEGERG